MIVAMITSYNEVIQMRDSYNVIIKWRDYPDKSNIQAEVG